MMEAVMVTDGQKLSKKQRQLQATRELFGLDYETARANFRKSFISWYWRAGIWTNKSSSFNFSVFNINGYFHCYTTRTKFTIRRKQL